MRYVVLGKRDLSLYSQYDTYATLSPNCRDSVAQVSFLAISMPSDKTVQPSVTVRQSLSEGRHTTLLPSLRETAKPASPSSFSARWDFRSFAPK